MDNHINPKHTIEPTFTPLDICEVLIRGDNIDGHIWYPAAWCDQLSNEYKGWIKFRIDYDLEHFEESIADPKDWIEKDVLLRFIDTNPGEIDKYLIQKDHQAKCDYYESKKNNSVPLELYK